MRVVHLLEKAIGHAEKTNDLLIQREPLEIIAFELQSLIDTLSHITGEITHDDVLDSIFSRFCIGK